MSDPQAGQPTRPRELDLDFVRGIAILMVLDFHSPRPVLLAPLLWLGFPHLGWAGVDIFFVLSGFLVGGLLMAEWKRHARVNAGRFLLRRSFKILPQYYLYLLLILLTGHRSFHQLAGNFLDIQNYTGGIPHTWSLAVEEHAYLLLALLVASAVLLRRRPRHVFLLLAAVVAVIHVLRLVLAIRGYPVFYATHTRLDGILTGVLLAMLLHFAPAAFTRLQQSTAVWIALLAAALVFLRLNPAAPWAQAVNFDAAGILAVALLMLLYRRIPAARPGLALYRLVATLGVYSYGIYIWHVATIHPVLVLGSHLPPALAPAWDAIMPILAAIAIGVASTFLIELPILRLRDRWYPRVTTQPPLLPAQPLADAQLGRPPAAEDETVPVPRNSPA